MTVRGVARLRLDGFVAGTWSVTVKGGSTTLEIKPAATVPKAAKIELTDEAERLVRFLGRDSKGHEVLWA